MSVFKYSPLFFSLFLTACGSDSEHVDMSDPVVIGCDLSDINSLLVNNKTYEYDAKVTEVDGQVRVEPVSSDKLLVNPDIGFTDFHRIDSHIDTDGSQHVDNSVPSYPETSTVYYRWDWSAIQPNNENEFDFTPICNVVKEAVIAHKKLAIRITAMEETSQVPGKEGTILEESRLPEWLMKKISGKISPNGPFVPDFTSETYLTAARNLVQELGNVFDSADYITSIDIGMVGSWGEWNLEDAYPGDGTLGLYASGEKGLFSNFSRFSEYADMFESAFTQVPRVMLIGSSNKNETFLAQATSSTKPAGWRADCLGDKYGYFSNSWSHMDEGYPEALANAEQHGSPDIKSIWKQAPVQFETCDDMTVWKTHHSYTINDVTEVFNYALDHHASLINAKSKPIPDEFQPAVQEVLKKLGYRFELISLTHSKEVLASSSMSITSEWKNSGVAPSYYPYRLAYRFVDASGNVEAKQETSRNVLDWLPAETRTDAAPVINLQDDINTPALTGIYDLQIALVNDLGDAQIKLAIDMPQENNWYTISKVTIN
ncbi:DUF4832 domain-containing protein [Aliivibrio fischeri]|uniref:DUF4832 domain-containing protein n=1 Tax=Aliivibrio fischeri TaxID=668 RepID=UPI0003101C03|nr:DUF4832 domain-containing protein [Aliivibrio fischeri]OCH07205.1 DUF4832 domain-containing protein [Aliivibrio fischeri]OEE09009.1 DUF4832 domain-containing protein [Aliivibrio fischeri ZF-211]